MAEDYYSEDDPEGVYVAPEMEDEVIESEVSPYLDPTWIILDSEPGMDDLMVDAGDSLEKMGEDLKIYPFQDRSENDRLFLARFEFPKFERTPRYSAAMILVPEGPPPKGEG